MDTLSNPDQARPWWKYGHLWMVIGGPLIVVVASFVSLYLAIHIPDPVYSDRSGSNSAEDVGDKKTDLTPAMQARNHAATGGIAPSAASPASATAPAQQ